MAIESHVCLSVCPVHGSQTLVVSDFHNYLSFALSVRCVLHRALCHSFSTSCILFLLLPLSVFVPAGFPVVSRCSSLPILRHINSRLVFAVSCRLARCFVYRIRTRRSTCALVGACAASYFTFSGLEEDDKAI